MHNEQCTMRKKCPRGTFFLHMCKIYCTFAGEIVILGKMCLYA